MKELLSSINNALMQSGLDLKKFFKSLKGLPAFISDYNSFKKNNTQNKFEIKKFYPCLLNLIR